MCARDLCAGLLDLGVGTELLVQGEADGLDRDVGCARPLEKGTENRVLDSDALRHRELADVAYRRIRAGT